ncbi:MAG: pilus assembly protein PilM [Planctomycetota bacterium]
MAKSDSAWGIDIGNSSLKAVRCRPGDQPDQVVADAFDYIEYPKILTQPGAEPEVLVRDALAQFQSRNSVRGDQVAISVSGQSGLARFIKLPPVESKRIPDIVKYEAKQQIPFDLNDVIWDYQQIAGGMEVEGFVLEAEVGLFAMKRDQVFRALEPFASIGIDVDYVQLTPLALYNFLVFDQLQDLPSPDEYDPESPPPSYVILSMGTDATDLVVTNGYRVWQRSIPLGGNHFTKALTKELKLTFAKAEHLKRNASSAQDPKAVFQAMRPVFNDLLTEIQRSVTYFSSIDRSAKIAKIVTLGNAMKLPGIGRYLGQSLGVEVVRLEAFRGMTGSEVVGVPAFSENVLTFGPCYGLALQALGKSALGTNLLPRELVKDRLIRQKKPWAVAAAAGLLLACMISFVGFSRAMGTMDESVFGSAEKEAKSAVDNSQSLKSAETAATSGFQATDAIGKHVVGFVEGRLRWLELLRAVNECLPSDPPDNRQEEISLRNELHVTSLECFHVDKLEDWFGGVKKWYETPAGRPQVTLASAASPAEPNAAPANNATQPAADAADASAPALGAASPAPKPAAGAGAEGGPTGPGWVIRLTGYHYHNRRTAVDVRGLHFVQGAQYVRETLIRALEGLEKDVMLPRGDAAGGLERVSMKELGIGYPVLVDPRTFFPETIVNPNADGAMQTGMGGMGTGGMRMGTGGMGPSENGMEGPGMASGGFGATRGQKRSAGGEEAEDAAIDLMRFNFDVQFSWQPKLPTERHEEEQAAEPQAEQADAGEA